MRALIAAALLCAVLVLGSIAVYAAGTVSGLVDINTKDVPVKQAIDSIFEGRGLKYVIEPGVTGRVVELRLKGVTVGEALKALGDAAGFTYRIEEGVYIIGPKKTIAADPASRPAPVVPRATAPQQVAAPPVRAVPQARTIAEAPPIIVNNYPANNRTGDSYAYVPPYSYGNPGYFPNGGYYNTGYYDPFYTMAPPPYMIGYLPPPPPPPGWFSPDVERFLRFQWAVPRRYGFITPY